MVVLTVFTLWITPESSDSNKSCVLYMTMSTFAAGLALWEGYKNGIFSIFGPFYEFPMTPCRKPEDSFIIQATPSKGV